MYAKLLSILLFTCQIILNESSSVEEDSDSESVEAWSPPVSNRTDGYFRFPGGQELFKVYEDVGISWLAARDRCIEDGAKLAIVDSVEKAEFIFSLKTKPDEDKWLHAGIYKLAGTDQWVRVDNDLPLSVVPWAKNYPDDDGDCSGVALVGNGLINYRCDREEEHCVCEKAIEENEA